MVSYYRLTVLVSIFILVLYGCGDDNPASPEFLSIEQRAFDLINQYRAEKGLSKLEWSDAIAEECRQHSKNMADGTVAFGHIGFEDRVKRINAKIPWIKSGENVAYNFNYPDQALKAYEDWLNSKPHRDNIETAGFNTSAMGVAKSSDGKYYFTQIFIQKK